MHFGTWNEPCSTLSLSRKRRIKYPSFYHLVPRKNQLVKGMEILNHSLISPSRFKILSDKKNNH